MQSTPRNPTPIDSLAENYFAEYLALHPIESTMIGTGKRQDEYDDLSPDGLSADIELSTRTLASLKALTPLDAIDRVTAAALHERLNLDIERHEAHLDSLNVNGIASGLHEIRSVYDLMPFNDDDQVAIATRRLKAIPEAIDGWFAAQDDAIAHGLRPAIRQVHLLAEQAASWAAPNGYFASLASRMATQKDSLREEITSSITVAQNAFASASSRLQDKLAPLATDSDAVGIDRYQLCSRVFLGTQIDLAETYAWGLDEVERVDAAQRQIAKRLGYSSAQEAKDALDADPAYLISGTDALREWMQTKADEALAALHPTHFIIAEPLRRIEAMIAPTTDGGIWYTPPSEDLTRPGRMWWSVPVGVNQFSTWRELTTVYHEGVPGHHLQFAQTLYNDQLNRWRRVGLWVSGHGEGWALYAEQLMAQLGFLDNSGDMLGMLDAQALRAVRVVIDIGLHCGFAAPACVGGGQWTWEKAWDYFNKYVSMEENSARFELNRYFGWPGQAPSYKLGQRIWEELRDTVSRRDGADFDLAAFHAQALDLGSVGLDVLQDALLSE